VKPPDGAADEQNAFHRVVNTPDLGEGRIVTRTASLVALTLALWVSACSGQTDGSVAGTITVDPVMTKGPADAAVTIVEFSDYQ